ncbi:hypothetical protein ABT255_58600 [Streptomyces mirabilis]|uniref:hypothetical protein n=1 Tax=Streptomyces mirabilis TaxID=68239 RepID=UPI0033257E6A
MATSPHASGSTSTAPVRAAPTAETDPIRRAVTLPMADGSSLGAFAPATKPLPESLADEETQRALASALTATPSGRDTDGGQPSAQVPKIAATAAAIGAPASTEVGSGDRRGGARRNRLIQRPLLIAAAVAGAVIAGAPFVSAHNKDTSDHEGKGALSPVTSRLAGTDGDAHTSGYSSSLPLLDLADGGAPAVTPPSTEPLPPSTAHLGTASDETGGTTKGAAAGRSHTSGQPVVLAPAGGDRPASPVKVVTGKPVAGTLTLAPGTPQHADAAVVAADPAKAATKSTLGPASGKTTAATKAKQTTTAAKKTTQWSTKVINGTSVLASGQSVASNRMRITMRSEGDLVISDENGVVRWSSHTSSSGAHAVFQGDGNLVIYSTAGKTLWSSGTAGHDGAELVIQNDGNVVVLSTDGRALWAAGTSH